VSTILRALQRVEGEKGGDAEMGGLREGVVSPGEPLVREGRDRWRIGIAASLAVLLLGFFLWWMIPGEEVTEPSAPISAEVATSPPPVAAAPPESRPRIAAPPPPPPVEVPAPRPVAAEPPPPVEEPAPQLAQPPPPVAAAPPESRPRIAAPPPPPPVEVPAPRPVAAPPLSSVEEPAPPKPVSKVPPPPAAKPPPPARVATVRPPKVTVVKTVWHPVPERRVARIEMEGYKEPLDLHEGDAVGTLVVAEIQPSGVVFLHGGEKLHRKVGKGR